MSAPEPSNSPAAGEQGGQTPFNEGRGAQITAGPSVETEATVQEEKTQSEEAPQPAIMSSESESLPGKMKGLSVSTDMSDSRPSSSSDVPPPPPEKDDRLRAASRPSHPPQSPIEPQPEWNEKELPEVPRQQEQEHEQEQQAGGNRGRSVSGVEDGRDHDSQPEIQSIMGQFQDSQEQIMSPRLELAEQFLGHFPPRQSSLDHMKRSSDAGLSSGSGPSSTEKQPAAPGPAMPPPPQQQQQQQHDEQMASRRSSTSTAPPPPEPEKRFDFHRFLEQLRHRTADPVAKFLRSFLHEFGKRQWMVHEQVKIISDFLVFITNKMAMCEVWRDVSDNEFDNAKEGMEKLVMNRLYSQTFSPVIPSPPAIPRSASRSKRREMERLHGPWRRGQHQEDIERDDVLAQKMKIYSWVKEEHLDIPPVKDQGHRFLTLAQQELLKINGYRAPRDKVICILNCCKVIFGLLRNGKKGDTSADSFVPILIFVVLKANPDHLVSNIQYILRFRNQEKLGGEAGYYLSSLSGAIQFIETLDRTSLTVSDEEFERNVEDAVSAIAEQNRRTESMEQTVAERHEPRSRRDPSRGSSEGQRRREAPAQSSDEDSAPVAGLLRTIQKPLSTIGRMFSDEPETPQDRTPTASQSPAPPRLTPNVYQPPRQSTEGRQSSEAPQAQQQLARVLDAQDAAARQASAEDAEARRIQRAEHNDVVETLSNMFPNLDRDVIDDVVKIKEGRVGLAVDACLALSSG